MTKLIGLLTLFAATSAHADRLQLSPESRLPLEEQRETGARMRNAGIVTAVAGALMAAVGAAFVVDASNPKRNDDGIFIEFPVGAALIASGGVGMITGLSLVGVGQTRANKADRATFSASAGGATIRF